MPPSNQGRGWRRGSGTLHNLVCIKHAPFDLVFGYTMLALVFRVKSVLGIVVIPVYHMEMGTVRSHDFIIGDLSETFR
jgi:hypothetical protein